MARIILLPVSHARQRLLIIVGLIDNILPQHLPEKSYLLKKPYAYSIVICWPSRCALDSQILLKPIRVIVSLCSLSFAIDRIENSTRDG